MKKNKLFLTLLFIAAAAVITGCSKEPQPAENPEVKTEAKASLPKLLDLGSKECIPCKKMSPILDELKADYAEKFETVFVDVWEDGTLATKHGVQAIPTQIFFDADGKELERHTGFMSKEDILAKWNELGYEF